MPAFAMSPQGGVGAVEMLEAARQEVGLVSYDDIMRLLGEIEAGGLEEKYSPEELEKIGRFIVYLAREGLVGDDADAAKILERDIEELFCGSDEGQFSYGYSLGDGRDYVMMPAFAYAQEDILHCKGWVSKRWKDVRHGCKEVGRFCKKLGEIAADHKKEILIGTGIFIATAAVVGLAIALSSAGAAAVGSAETNKNDKDGSKNEGSSSQATLEDAARAMNALNEAPLLKSIIDENVAAFKDAVVDDTNKSVFSWEQTARDLGAACAHQTWDGVSEILSLGPRLGDEIRSLASLAMPGMVSERESLFEPLTLERFEKSSETVHNAIDRIFDTEQAAHYTREAKENRLGFVIGELPPPGRIAVEGVLSEKAMIESAEKFKHAESILGPYKGKYLPEVKIRELLHEVGIETFPRPRGIPNNYRVKLADKSGGMKYVHPKNEGTYVRMMPGKPHSPFPHQRKPYVNHRINGQSIDKFGNKVPNDSIEAHIPLDEFIFKSN